MAQKSIGLNGRKRKRKKTTIDWEKWKTFKRGRRLRIGEFEGNQSSKASERYTAKKL